MAQRHSHQEEEERVAYSFATVCRLALSQFGYSDKEMEKLTYMCGYMETNHRDVKFTGGEAHDAFEAYLEGKILKEVVENHIKS